MTENTIDRDKIIQEIKRASEIENPNTFAQSMRERINTLWSCLGCITVECPKCKHRQNVTTVKSTVCMGCLVRYKICPPKKPTQIVWCNPHKISILHEIQSLELDSGKRGAIL